MAIDICTWIVNNGPVNPHPTTAPADAPSCARHRKRSVSDTLMATKKLFYYPNASMAPHIVLEEIGQPFELMLVDRAQQAHKSADYLRLNPNGLIPAFVDGDRCCVRNGCDMPASGRHAPRLRIGPHCGDTRTRGVLQVADVVDEHAANHIDRLLLPRALGRS